MATRVGGPVPAVLPGRDASEGEQGEVITALSALLAIPTAQIATIGDMPNDVLMFERRPEHRYGQREAQVQRRAKL